MNNTLKYIALLVVGTHILISCDPEFENELDNRTPASSGKADFSKYVALGNSLTAGVADGTLYLDGQIASYPNIMAEQMEFAGGGEFKQPLISDNLGGLLVNGQYNPLALPVRRVLRLTASNCSESEETVSPSPVLVDGTPTTEATTVLPGSFNNMGVPGAKSFHLGLKGYGNPTGIGTTANPYYVRFASNPEASVIEDAIAQQPTFFTLWIGNNDILGYATSGGTGVNQTGNLDPRSYGGNDITDPNVFASSYSGYVEALTGIGAKGVLINLPDVTSIPFFTTVPNNALVLTAEQAAGLTSFFQVYAGIFAQGLVLQGLATPEQAQALAAQYAITFNEGPNRFLIDVPPSSTNPQGFRQMTNNELLLLTIDQCALRTQGYGSVVLTPEVLQVLGKLQQGGTPTAEEGLLVLNAVNSIDDKDVLDSAEIAEITTAKEAYNAIIKGLAEAKGLAFLDADTLLKEVATTGIRVDGGIVTSEFVRGGGFSLDGVHLTPRGYALIANNIMRVTNETYDSKLTLVQPGTYKTITVE